MKNFTYLFGDFIVFTPFYIYQLHALHAIFVLKATTLLQTIWIIFFFSYVTETSIWAFGIMTVFYISNGPSYSTYIKA